MSEIIGSEVKSLFEENTENLVDLEEKQESLTVSSNFSEEKQEQPKEKFFSKVLSFLRSIPLREYIIIFVISIIFILCFSDYLWTRKLNKELSALSLAIQEYKETSSQLNTTLGALNTNISETVTDIETTISQVEEIDNILTHQSIVFRGKVYTVPEPYYVEDGELIDPNTSIHYVITYVDETTLKPYLQPTKQSIYLYIFEMAEVLDKSDDIAWTESVYNAIMNYSSKTGKYPTFPLLSSEEEISAFLEVIGVSDK